MSFELRFLCPYCRTPHTRSFGGNTLTLIGCGTRPNEIGCQQSFGLSTTIADNDIREGLSEVTVRTMTRTIEGFVTKEPRLNEVEK